MLTAEKTVVLLMEDDELDVRQIEEALRRAPDVAFDLLHSRCLAEGLASLAHNGVDVLLLDLNLPDSNGANTVLKIRKDFPDLPMVVLTGLDERDVGLKAIRAGAQDYLTKNRVDSELLTRSLLYAIERQHVEANTRQWEAARLVQNRLFRSEAPPIPGFDIAGLCRAAEAVGGDYFDFVTFSDGTFGILVADVSGNGLGAAVLMGETRSSIRALARAGMTPEYIVRAVNQTLYEEVAPENFITLFLVHLDPTGRSMRFLGAGHEAWLLRACGEVQTLESMTFPLAFEPELDCELSPPLSLSDGDIVLLLTDGVFEARNAQNELFGIDRATEAVRQNASQPAGAMVAAINKAVTEFTGHDHLNDDATIVVVKVGNPE